MMLSPSSTNGHVNPWERLPNESSKAFSAFCMYRDLGRDRSLSKVGESLSISRQAVGQWSSKFGWVPRATAWDSHAARVIGDAVLHDLVRQARQLQQVAHH